MKTLITNIPFVHKHVTCYIIALELIRVMQGQRQELLRISEQRGTPNKHGSLSKGTG